MSKYLKRRAASFVYAFRGVAELLRGTPNAVIHVVMAVAAVVLGFYFGIDRGEWLAIIIVIGLVLALEAVNTAIEGLADMINEKHDENIRRIKDVAAGAVLMAAIAALVVGMVIFLPKIFY